MDEIVPLGGKGLKYVAVFCRDPRRSKGLVLAGLLAVLTTHSVPAQPILIESRTSTNTDNSAYWSYPAGTWGTSGNLSDAPSTPPFVAAGSRQTTNTSGPPAFHVQPTNTLSLQPGTPYAVQVTSPSSATQPPPDDLVVGISATGVTNNTLPATTTAFSTDGTNIWLTLGQIIASNASPGLTFTYVSGSIGASPARRLYAQCVRFIPQARTNGLHVWNGAAEDPMWNNPTNWQGGAAPNLSGDDVALAGTTGLVSIPDGPFSVNCFKFLTNAGAFAVGTHFSGPLTIATTNGLVNQSSNHQTILSPFSQGSVPLVVDTGSRTLTISNLISGTGGYSVKGTGVLYLRHFSDITGPVIVNSNATLRLAKQDHLGGTGPGAGDVTVDGGTLQNDDTFVGADFITANRSLLIGPGGATLSLPASSSQSLIYNGVVATSAGNGTLSKIGSGRLTFGGSSANTFTGLTTVTAGRLILGKSSGNAVAGNLTIPGGMVELSAGEQIADDANVTVSGGTFIFGSPVTETVGQVVLDSGSITGSVSSTLIATNFEMRAGTVWANLGGTAPLNKSTTGTVTLMSDCAYTGNTTVSNGTLLVQADIGPGLVTVYGGTLGGTGAVSGPVIVQSGGTLAPGGAPGQLTLTDTLTLAAGSTCRLEINRSTQTNDTVVGMTTLNYGGTLIVTNLAGTLGVGDTFKLFDAAVYTNSFASFNLPALSSGLGWSTAGLANDGTLAIVGSPQIVNRSVVGGNFIMSGTGGVPFTAYQVLTSTNITWLTNWSAIATNAFDSGGAFSFTNPAPPTPPWRFFIIKVP